VGGGQATGQGAPPAFASPVEAEIALTGYKLDTKLEFGEHKDYTKDYPGLPKDYPSLSKDYPSLSKDYPSLSKEYPGLSKDYASLPKEYLSKDYAKDYMAGGLMKASDYHKLGAGPLHHGDYKPYSDISLSKPSLGDYKPGDYPGEGDGSAYTGKDPIPTFQLQQTQSSKIVTTLHCKKLCISL